MENDDLKERINSLLHDLSVKEAKKCETEEDIEKKVVPLFFHTWVTLNKTFKCRWLFKTFKQIQIFETMICYFAGIDKMAENVQGLDVCNRS